MEKLPADFGSRRMHRWARDRQARHLRCDDKGLLSEQERRGGQMEQMLAGFRLEDVLERNGRRRYASGLRKGRRAACESLSETAAGGCSDGLLI